MTEAANDLLLLERVFLRLGSATTDEQLENVLCKFLAPVLLKLASPHESVRKKVMEFLIHVNKITKTRQSVQLPVEPLLTQYQEPNASSFVINFTIIYIRLGYPRLPTEKQVELVPTIINALQDKPVTHLDSLLLLIIPLLGRVKVPTEPEKVKTFLGLQEKSSVAKHFLQMLLDVLLLPYNSLSLQSQESDANNSQIALPQVPGLSAAAVKRLTQNNFFKPEEFESVKLGIIKFLSHGIFKSEDVLIHFIVGASDTRFEVTNLADMELRKIVGSVDWTSSHISRPLFAVFLGDKGPNQRPPASTRIRLKLLTYLCRAYGDAFLFPVSIQLIFDSLYGENTNVKLKTLALNFTINMIRSGESDSLTKLAPVLLAGLNKFIKEGGEPELLGQTYIIIGMLAQKCPLTVFNNVKLLESFFDQLEQAEPNLKTQIREGLLSLIQAYKYDICSPEQLDLNGRLGIMLAFLKLKMGSTDSMVRFVSVRALITFFPPDHVPSKFLVLIATGDREDDIRQEASKSIYGFTRKNDFETENRIDKNLIPSFQDMTKCVYNESFTDADDQNKEFNFGKTPLPFSNKIYLEILLYLRLCLLKDADMPLSRDALRHPCEYTPKIVSAIRKMYDDSATVLRQYCSMVRGLLLVEPGVESLSCTIELVASVPELHQLIKNDLNWIRDQLKNVKEEVRELVAVLYSLLLAEEVNDAGFDAAINYFLDVTAKGALELQHGALLCVGYCIEAYILKKKRAKAIVDKIDLIKECLFIIAQYLTNKNSLLIGAAATSTGSIARLMALPLDNGRKEEGSPQVKKQAVGVTKLEVIESLLEIMNNAKLSAKIREKAATALGLMCVGEKLSHTRHIILELLKTAKDTKDVEVHFTIGESLLMCCQSIASPEARDSWFVLADDYKENASDPVIDENLDFFLEEVLKLTKQPHPNSKQASSIWLLAVLKGCGDREPISKRLQVLQNTFMELLSENNDIIQDVSSKGLCVLYDLYKSEDLLSTLVNRLTLGTRNVAQVTSDTKLFEDGQLGAAPSGENLTTYKELCALASDLNKPDLMYQFMHLVNHNVIWNSKKGAAFGFSSIAQRCSEDLKKMMPEVVPKLYRYQYDPSPAIHHSMSNIWRNLVSDSQTALDTYYHEILKDLLENINSSQYRVRQSCCLALQDFLKGSAKRSIHDAVDYMDDLWNKLFRVMDDHHEETRVIANRTTRVLSKLCIRGCDFNQGKAGVKMVDAVLPILLNTGITHTVSEIRMISLQTVSELINSAGSQIKPSLPKLIPALLQATGELESAKLSYLSTMMGAQTETQEAIDNARASIAKSHFTTETVTKSLRYADGTILEELIPKVLELLKPSVGLGTRIACAHFITLLVVQFNADVKPFAGKILAVLVSGLTDRNSAVRKHNAIAIGHLVVVCKTTSLEKLFAKLKALYFEREDDTIRSAIACTIQSIGIHNQEIIKTYSSTVLPLVFFAMHSQKTPETQHTLDMWTEIWSENTPGTESGIRHNIEPISDMLKLALESSSWSIKAQAADAVATVANKLGATMDVGHSDTLLKILLAGLSGKTWKGKDKLLKALCSISSNCTELLKSRTESKNEIIDVLCREARKQEILYKIVALECLGDAASALEVDAFESVNEIAKSALESGAERDDDAEQKEHQTGLKVVAYETLGKSWPENSPQTQEKYRELFVDHCVATLPKVTRPVQIAILSALYNFVNKLYLLRKDQLTQEEESALGNVVDKILEAVNYSFGISKHTRLRKEALNILFCLGAKLKEKNHRDLQKLAEMFSKALPDLANDTQPEIKCRLEDIKQQLRM